MKHERATKKQQELLEYVTDFIREHDYGPSYREIMRALDYKSVSTVATHINGLVAKGFLNRRDNSPRSLEVATASKSAPTKTTDEIMKAADKLLADDASNNSEPLHALVATLRILGRENEATELEAKVDRDG